MKKYIYYELVKQLSRRSNHGQKQRWLKKLKYLALFAVVGMLLLGGAAIWGTVIVVEKFAGSLNPPAIQASAAKGIEEIRVAASQPITTKECIAAVKGVLTPTALLTVPISNNFETIRNVCWNGSKAKEEKKQS